MNFRTPIKLFRLVASVKNPLPILLDRLGWKKTPYRLRLRNAINIELRPGRGDLGAFRDCWLNRCYVGGGGQLLRGSTVVDVGANIGCFTLFAALSVGSAGRIISIEPDAETFHQLQRHIKLNRLENVVTMHAAVAAEPGLIDFHSCHDGLYSSIFSKVDGRFNTGAVQCVTAFTLDQILSKVSADRCHFLKLDCEGAEHGIIHTMSAQTAARIDQIGMELHKVEGIKEDALIRRLQHFGFKMTRRGALLYFRRT